MSGVQTRRRYSNEYFLLVVMFLASISSIWAYTPQLTRRGWMTTTQAVSIIFTGTVLEPSPRSANALEKRNEALCGTGFFTNIAQYKCTEIGDISGDGKAKDLSSEEEASVDSLMGKLGLDDSTNTQEDTKSDGEKK
jgi:hypothetical protein